VANLPDIRTETQNVDLPPFLIENGKKGVTTEIRELDAFSKHWLSKHHVTISSNG
jgi:hypothetical protein